MSIFKWYVFSILLGFAVIVFLRVFIIVLSDILYDIIEARDAIKELRKTRMGERGKQK